MEDASYLIHYAAKNGHVKVMEVFFDSVKDMNVNAVTDEKGFSILHLAVLYNHDNIVSLLITAKNSHRIPSFDFDAQDNEGKTALHHAVIEGNIKIVSILANYFETDLSIQDKNYKTAFDYALERKYGGSNCLDILKILESVKEKKDNTEKNLSYHM